MIGFIAAVSGVLAIIVLVAIANFLTFVMSILPDNGLVQIDEYKYRFYLEDRFVTPVVLDSIVQNIFDYGFLDNIRTFQTGCNHGFNYDLTTVEQVSTYNYIVVEDYMDGRFDIDPILIEVDENRFNTCYVDINLIRPHAISPLSGIWATLTTSALAGEARPNHS